MGADSNLFHQGAAGESDDPDVIAATLKRPGVVLKRPVGSDRSFNEQAALPANLSGSTEPTKSARKSKGSKAKKPPSRPIDKAAERKAAPWPTNGRNSAARVNWRGKGREAEGARTPEASRQ